MRTVDGLDPSGDDFIQNVRELNAVLQDHMEKEETQLWPLIRSQWGEDNLDEAGEKWSGT